MLHAQEIYEHISEEEYPKIYNWLRKESFIREWMDEKKDAHECFVPPVWTHTQDVSYFSRENDAKSIRYEENSYKQDF